MAETHFKGGVFISYSSADEGWVVDTLLPRFSGVCQTSLTWHPGTA